jgi:hypothetical protein
MRYRDQNGQHRADIIDMLTMDPKERRNVVRVLAEIDSVSRQYSRGPPVCCSLAADPIGGERFAVPIPRSRVANRHLVVPTSPVMPHPLVGSTIQEWSAIPNLQPQRHRLSSGAGAVSRWRPSPSWPRSRRRDPWAGRGDPAIFAGLRTHARRVARDATSSRSDADPGGGVLPCPIS